MKWRAYRRGVHCGAGRVFVFGGGIGAACVGRGLENRDSVGVLISRRGDRADFSARVGSLWGGDVSLCRSWLWSGGWAWSCAGGGGATAATTTTNNNTASTATSSLRVLCVP